MKVGDLVRVNTKYYGIKIGLIVEQDDDGWHIQPLNHPRQILAFAGDIHVINETGMPVS